jgi:hypothetical protein
MRAALIDSSNTVENVVELDPHYNDPENITDSRYLWTPPAGITVVFSDIAQIGMSYDGSSFS